MRIRCDKRRSLGTSDLGGNAVGETDGACAAVVVASAQEAGVCGEPGVDRNRFGETELSKIEGGVLFGRTFEPHEVIEHLCDAHCRERRRLPGFQKTLDVRSGRFSFQ